MMAVKDGHIMVARNQKERDIDIGLDGGGADFRNRTLGLRVRREFFLVFFRGQRRKFFVGFERRAKDLIEFLSRFDSLISLYLFFLFQFSPCQHYQRINRFMYHTR